MTCQFCEEDIPWDEAVAVNTAVSNVRAHRDCILRAVVGSIGHQQGTCSCYGGHGNGDPIGVSEREAARVAGEYFRKHQKQMRAFKWTQS